jgi:transglutaminase-like putative cysteine protease
MSKRFAVQVIFFLAFSLSVFSLKAQNFEEIRKQYPSEKAVFVDKLVDYTFVLKDDKPYVESREKESIAFLSQSASNYMGSFSFYHSFFRELINYAAQTRTADNKVIKVSNFKTASDKQSFVFYDDVKKMSFNYPSIEPGAVGSLDVSWVNKDPHLLPTHYFRSYMPVLNSELKLTVANGIVIKYHKMGLDTASVVVTIDKGKRNTIYTFKYKNCAADRGYGDAPGYAWYSPHIVFSIDSYKDSQGKTISYLANNDDLYQLNYSYIKDINANVSAQVKRVTDSLTANLKSPEAKARKIYNWVQQNIKYVAFEDGMGGFVPREAALVCTRRFGDCKDMASILTQMMGVAGIEAHYTWIGTRNLPYKFSITPLPLVSNHMICTIKLDGNYIYLDGTDPTCVFGIPASHIQDKEAMIAVNNKEYKIAVVPTVEKTQNVLVDTTWVEMMPNGIKGRIRQNLAGYFASDAYSKLMYWGEKDLNDHMKGEFTRGTNKFNLDSFAIDRKLVTNQMIWQGNFTLPGYATKVGDEYYLNLNLFRFFENSKIEIGKRNVPIAHDFKYSKKYVTILNLPTGYKLTYMPKGQVYNAGEMSFSLSYEQKNNQVIFIQEYTNNELILTQDKFESWNKMLDVLFPTYKEILSFSKI